MAVCVRSYACVCAFMPISVCVHARPCFSEVVFVYKNMTCGSPASESCVYKGRCSFHLCLIVFVHVHDIYMNLKYLHVRGSMSVSGWMDGWKDGDKQIYCCSMTH